MVARSPGGVLMGSLEGAASFGDSAKGWLNVVQLLQDMVPMRELLPGLAIFLDVPVDCIKLLLVAIVRNLHCTTIYRRNHLLSDFPNQPGPILKENPFDNQLQHEFLSQDRLRK